MHCLLLVAIILDLRKSLNSLRRELNIFHETVDIMAKAVTRLEREVNE